MKSTFVVSRGSPRARMSLAFVALFAISALPSAVRAGGVVTHCTEAALRAALAGGGTVTLACDGTIVLTNTLSITNNTTIDATGFKVALDGGGARQVLSVGTFVSFKLVNVVVTNGNQDYFRGDDGLGGGLLNEGNTWLENCTFAGNRVLGFCYGGAVYHGAGSLRVVGCSFIGNQAVPQSGNFARGGAIGAGVEFGNRAGPIFITNSTFAGNSAEAGGAIWIGDNTGSGMTNGPVYLVNCTFASNTNGGVAADRPERVSLRNTILSSASGANLTLADYVDGGGNLSSDASLALNHPTSRTNIDLRLGTLGSYGGPTPTVSLLPDSPAINAADCAGTLPFDQRGIPRPYAGGCDSGAFEATVIGTNSGQFVFSSPDYRVASGTGNAVITVLRQSGTIGSASVAFATQNGTAVGGTDYTATNGILAFAEGEAIRTFVVALNPVLSVPKTISLSLSNPTGGASLGIYSNSVLTIGPQPLTECTDAGLRAALAVGGVVTVACDGIIVLTNTLVITNNATLDASGHEVTISGSNAVRLFWVNSNVSLTLVNLKLADGYAKGPNGTVSSPVSIEHVDGWPGIGGAIYNDGGAVVAADCSFLRNRAIGGEGVFWGGGKIGKGGAGMGGAIYSLFGSLTLTNTSFHGNSASGGFGGYVSPSIQGSSGGAEGGAVHLASGNLVLQNSRFTTNSAAGGGAFGGAIFVTNTTSRTEISVFTGNSVQGSEMTTAAGGAAYQTGGDAGWTGSLFSSNSATGGPASRMPYGSGIAASGMGGGLALYGAAGLTNCSILDNRAESGGGTWKATSISQLPAGSGGGINSRASLSMVNCTIAGNRALGSAEIQGGHAYGGGLNLGGSTVLNSVTIAHNIARGVGGVPGPGGPPITPALSQGGGIRGSTTLRNTLLASNVEGGNFYGAVTDDGRNLSSDASIALNAAGSLTNTDPKLGLLGNFGGLTPTIPLLASSPAIDAGNPAWCPPTDQRGVARPVGAGCDIGAFEGSIPNYPQLAMTFTPATAVTSSVVVLTYTLSNPNTNALNNVSFANTLPPELRVAPVPGLSNGCGSGSINAVAGGGLVTVTNVALAANQSCSFAVNVVGPAPGLVTNTVGPVSSAETGPGAAIASAVLSLASSITGPSVVTGPASNIQEHSATLTGTVNPNGAATTAWFEYGATASYGSMSSIINLGAGYVATNVAADLANLPTKAVLHYRLVAQNIAGTTYGADQVFSALTYGVTNFALQFDGADDRVQVAQGGGMDGLTQGTIELWVRWNGVQPTESTYGQHGAVFSRSGSYGRQAILALDNPNPASAHVTWSPYNTTRALTGQKFVGDGVWHHVAVTFAPGAHRLYLDGVLEASGTQNGVLGSDPSGYVSLANLANTATFARGTLDEIRVWSMARNDIAYNMRRPLDSATPGLIGYWRLDEGTGVIAHDATGHGYDGELFNGPLWVLPTNTVAYGMYVTSSKLGNQLRLTVTGQPTQPFVLQRTSDLLNWSGVVTNVLGANGQYLYTEPSINTAPQRLYRVRTP